jgi:hypothetical protein
MPADAGPCFDFPFRLTLHKILRYNSSFPKPGAPNISEEILVSDVIFVLVIVVFFALSILYLRGCERLK